MGDREYNANGLRVAMHPVRVVGVVGVALILAVQVSSVAGQTLSLKPVARHVSVEPGASAPQATPGGSLTLWADVTPEPKMHVYAEGAKAFDFTPVALVLAPNASIATGKPRYPPAQPAPPGSIDEKTPIYTKAFRIEQPISIRPTAKRGDVTVSGSVTYQACDDRVCYPAASVPVQWTVTVR